MFENNQNPRKKMKSNKIQSIAFGALLAAGALITPTLRAQAEGAGAPPPPPAAEGSERPGQGGPGGQGQARGERMVQQLRERLKLTDEQVEKLKPILQAQMEELRALRQENQGADRAALREKMQAIRAKYQGQIEAVLTDEQKAIWAKMQERGPRGEGRQGGPGAGGPPTPPPAE